MLLIVTNKQDLTADYLVLRMRARRIPFVRLNTEDFGRAFWLSIAVSPADAVGHIHFANDQPPIRASEVTGAYIRRPHPPASIYDIDDAHREFADREQLETLRCFWTMIPNERWLNPPESLRVAAVKTRQLLVARQCGFRIPATLTSDHRHTIERFAQGWKGSLITKAVRSGFIRTGDECALAGTRRLPNSFPADLHQFAPVPAVYQPEISKDHDIRATVIGGQVFAAAIHSQDREETAVDWRIPTSDGSELHHEPADLEPDLVIACRTVTERLGLRYSAIDLIRTKDNDVVFLEANPNGEWMWLEEACGFPLRDTIIDTLLGAV